MTAPTPCAAATASLPEPTARCPSAGPARTTMAQACVCRAHRCPTAPTWCAAPMRTLFVASTVTSSGGSYSRVADQAVISTSCRPAMPVPGLHCGQCQQLVPDVSRHGDGRHHWRGGRRVLEHWLLLPGHDGSRSLCGHVVSVAGVRTCVPESIRPRSMRSLLLTGVRQCMLVAVDRGGLHDAAVRLRVLSGRQHQHVCRLRGCHDRLCCRQRQLLVGHGLVVLRALPCFLVVAQFTSVDCCTDCGIYAGTGDACDVGYVQDDQTGQCLACPGNVLVGGVPTVSCGGHGVCSLDVVSRTAAWCVTPYVPMCGAPRD